jgi:hypothetical protein
VLAINLAKVNGSIPVFPVEQWSSLYLDKILKNKPQKLSDGDPGGILTNFGSPITGIKNVVSQKFPVLNNSSPGSSSSKIMLIL